MQSPKIKSNKKYELRDRLIDFLRIRDWFVLNLHCNAQSVGFPNLWVTHKIYKSRFIHCKSTACSNYTASQIESFAKLSAFGSGVWVLNDDSNNEYLKLWRPANWTEHKNQNHGGYNRIPPPPESYGPERKIQDNIIKALKVNQWYPLETHGNLFQRGIPDLFATHSIYGSRWIEVKNPENYSFTAAQLEIFPKICEHGSGVWVLGGPSELDKLLQPYNWHQYLVALNHRTSNLPRCTNL